MRRFLPLMFILLLSTYANTSAAQILLPLNGTITGTPGDFIGWGFTITNTPNFLVLTGSQFCGVGSVPPFCYSPTPSLGSFADFTGSQLLVVGTEPEASSLTQHFDNIARTGVGSFSIDSEALPGSKVMGVIELTYDLFSVSPNSANFNPLTDTISNGNFLTAKAEVDVISGVPEPSSSALLACGLLSFVGTLFMLWMKSSSKAPGKSGAA